MYMYVNAKMILLLKLFQESGEEDEGEQWRR
jgi:hypothetical protein